MKRGFFFLFYFVREASSACVELDFPSFEFPDIEGCSNLDLIENVEVFTQEMLEEFTTLEAQHESYFLIPVSGEKTILEKYTDLRFLDYFNLHHTGIDCIMQTNENFHVELTEKKKELYKQVGNSMFSYRSHLKDMLGYLQAINEHLMKKNVTLLFKYDVLIEENNRNRRKKVISGINNYKKTSPSN